MARPKSDSKIKAETKQVARPPRPKTTTQKVEELKLGKFEKREPLRLPEKEVRRGWQITGAIALMLGAIVGLYAIFMLEPVRGLTWDRSDVSPFGGLEIYEELMIVGIAVATLTCIIASVMLLVKKRVPVFFWYVLVVATTMVALCASFHTFKWFEARNCYENYPGIYPGENRGSGCPSVENDLIWLSLRNLLLYTVGLVAFFAVYKVARRRGQRQGH